MNSSRILIIDYGRGNLYNVKKAFDFIGADAAYSADPLLIEKADALVLPGVGAFKEGMEGLRKGDLITPILDFVATGKPLFGICLGLQMLMDESEEFGLCKGLGLVRGRVQKIPDSERNQRLKYPIPHMGWAAVRSSAVLWSDTLFHGMPEGFMAYHVHSYFVLPSEENETLGEIEYGERRLCTAVKKGNIYGVQFHPEKSAQAGLEILKIFLKIANSLKQHV